MEPRKVNIVDENGNGYECCLYKGILLPGFYNSDGAEKRMNFIRNIPYKDGDVLLCSYPKSGTHWVTNLIELLKYEGPLVSSPSYTIALVEVFQKYVQNLQSPRLLASHSRFEFLPAEHVARKGKIILMVRNVKDVLVSYYHHLRTDRFIRSGQSWNHYVESFLKGNVMFSSYFDYLLSWERVIQQENLNILVVQYEDLHTNPMRELKRIQAFLGYNRSDERLREILERTSIHKLRADVNSKKVRTMMVDENRNSFVYRQGKIGDWKNHLTVAQNRLVDKVIETKLGTSMFKFTYEPPPQNKL